MKEKVKSFVKTALRFVLNPRLLLCFGIAWMITNGWSYILLAVGTALSIKWMIAVSGAYLAILWMPSPEKIITLAIAIFLLKRLFPNDTKTLGVLKQLRDKVKEKKLAHDKKQKNEE